MTNCVFLSRDVDLAACAVAFAVCAQGTLEFALRPYRIPAEILREKHEAVLGMITIFLGEKECL